MRSRLTSANSSRKILLKPRFGRRRWIGIWPPSKPLMRTPERAVWPLPPRPAVLPDPEPMPRPRRCRVLLDPGRSASSLSFIGFSSLLLFARHARACVGHPDYRGNTPLIGLGGTSPAMTVKLLRVHNADDVLDL